MLILKLINYFFQLLTFGDFTYITMKLNKTKKKNEKETKKSYSCLQALIDIFMENDAVYSTWLDRSYSGTRLRFRKLEDGNYELVDDDRKPLADLPVYVNVRNERRYFRSTPIKDALSENRRDWPIHLKISLRKQKALHLYHLIREYKLFDWWD